MAARSRRVRVRLPLLLVAGAAVVGGVWSFREPLRHRIAEEATLANDAPTAEAVEDMIQQASAPRPALLAAWNSGKIVHREVAIRSLGQLFSPGQALPAEFDSLLLTAALDPDMNVRETALTIMQQRNHPALAALAAEQLKDFDLDVRLLGLDHLKSVDSSVGVPIVLPLLDDPDPLLVSTSLKLLEKWSGQTFGVKLSETASFENERTGLLEYREGSSEKAKAGAQRAKAWWANHQSEFPPVPLPAPNAAYAGRQAVPALDFQLRALDGRKIRLSEFRGKVVLVNFWTTWCPACLSEMPALIALQKKHQGNFVILGVSLDYIPDEHGHIGGHEAAEEQSNGAGQKEEHERSATGLKQVREKIARAVQVRGINYPVLLDEKNEVGGRYNGGELPTTIIVDARGNVRRRFIGARSLPVFEAMLAEAAQEPAPGSSAALALGTAPSGK